MCSFETFYFFHLFLFCFCFVTRFQRRSVTSNLCWTRVKTGWKRATTKHRNVLYAWNPVTTMQIRFFPRLALAKHGCTRIVSRKRWSRGHSSTITEITNPGTQCTNHAVNAPRADNLSTAGFLVSRSKMKPFRSQRALSSSNESKPSCQRYTQSVIFITITMSFRLNHGNFKSLKFKFILFDLLQEMFLNTENYFGFAEINFGSVEINVDFRFFAGSPPGWFQVTRTEEVKRRHSKGWTALTCCWSMCSSCVIDFPNWNDFVNWLTKLLHHVLTSGSQIIAISRSKSCFIAPAIRFVGGLSAALAARLCKFCSPTRSSLSNFPTTIFPRQSSRWRCSSPRRSTGRLPGGAWRLGRITRVLRLRLPWSFLPVISSFHVLKTSKAFWKFIKSLRIGPNWSCAPFQVCQIVKKRHHFRCKKFEINTRKKRIYQAEHRHEGPRRRATGNESDHHLIN